MPQSLDLTRLLPATYRDKTLDTLLRNLFNRHLSKLDTVPIYGYVGESQTLGPGEIQVKERDLERQINQLIPFVYGEHATEKRIYTWADLVQKMVLLGVDYSQLEEIFTTASYNLVPPVDLDKFCNFNNYFWIGPWIQADDSLPYEELGIFNVLTDVADAFARTNPEYLPEYYVIARSETDSPPQPYLTTWSDWALCNLWVHRDDIITFLSTYGGTIGFGQLIQASRSIIEYSDKVRLNHYVNAQNEPSDSGTLQLVEKLSPNQPPLFDLFNRDGTHSGYASAIFYYLEGSEYPVDEVLNRRLAKDDNADFIFEHSLVNPANQELFFYQVYEGDDPGEFVPYTIWRKGPDVGPRYVKYDAAGTLINHDTFVNYRNYFWVAVDVAPSMLPSYNPTGLPEYSVIERGGVSDWSTYNYWVHVSNLKRSELSKYIQAERPIIEFNKTLEAELLEAKTTLYQLPRFQHYLLNPVNGDYEPLLSGSDVNLNDAYLSGSLFVRTAELPNTDAAVAQTQELKDRCVTFNDETYLQGLYSGKYVSIKDGFNYGYTARMLEFRGEGNGSVISLTAADTAIPELIQLLWDDANSVFKVTGSVTGAQPDLTLNTVYEVSGASFSVIEGSTPFADGDIFVIQIRSSIFVSDNLYVKLDGAYRTLSSANEILNEVQNTKVIPATPALRDGIWEVPPQLQWNVSNETRTQIGEGDIYFHFISIIAAQAGLIGSESGSNNWRTLDDIDVGLGGIIKQYDGDMGLFISTLIQEGVTLVSLIDFAQQGYEAMFSAIQLFLSERVPELLTEGAFTPPTSGDSIDPRLVEEFKKYFGMRSDVVLASTTPTDDNLATRFYDSTSSIDNLVVTLPYLGLVDKVLPRKELDLELNLEMLIHHDGHKRQLVAPNEDLLKAIVTKRFRRSPGQETAGVVTGASFPEKPYKGQFWFKTSTSQLFYYNVVSDTSEFPTDVLYGSYSYNRQTGQVYEYNGIWNYIGDSTVTQSQPWTEVKLDLISANLELALETELYENCPELSNPIDTVTLEANEKYVPNMQKEFERFGVRYNVADPYSSTFDSTNAFTWNYSSETYLGASGPQATWQEVYRDIYGTPRPDLEPWIPGGYGTEANLLNDLITYGYIPLGTTEWTLDLWSPVVGGYISSAYANNGRPGELSVDVTTGALLPPYHPTDLNALTNVPPASAGDRFEFGDLGPVELFWTKTLNYLYSQQRTYFRLAPLEYTSNTWGVKKQVVNEYTMEQDLGRKASPVDFPLHGDELPTLTQTSWLDVNVLVAPIYETVYTLSCVSRLENIFKLETEGQDPIFFSENYADFNIELTLNPTIRGFFWGDTYTITVDTAGGYTVVLDPQEYYRAEGFNQVYVQYQRSFGSDLSISINHSLFNDWVVKLGYRFSGLVNTDTILLKSGDQALDETTDNGQPRSYKIHLKENKFYNSSWLNALRIQLVQRGSVTNQNGIQVPVIGPGGTPGEDWIFRVDNYNSARPELSWYTFDTTSEGSFQTFVALDGSKTSFPWKHYTGRNGTLKYAAPFLITGIQNVVNFLFGYSDLLDADGWRFNDQENPLIDSTTGRPVGFQLIIEQFCAQQFGGVTAGSSFLVNPFYRKVWYATPRGAVSDLFDEVGTDQDTTSAVYDKSRKQLKKSQLRLFRQDALTQFVFDEPVFTVHLLSSEYEHVVLFENYSSEVLLYDPFLGQQMNRFFVNGEKQANFSGRIDFGGHFMLGGQMKRNIESSVENILKLYDTNADGNLPEIEHGRSILGFQKKNYFEERGTPDPTEFRFFQGMIANKGTNFSVNAYVNSASYKTAKMDEYWAYRLAKYGDARDINHPELKVESADCTTELSNYLFLEKDELELIREYLRNGGYDVPKYDVTAYDVFTLYTNETQLGVEYFDPRGCIIIRPDDEQRWFRYKDLNAMNYFEADIIAEMFVTPTALDSAYIIRDTKGNPVRADCFEVWDMNYTEGSDAFDIPPYDINPYDAETRQVYYENGDYIVGTDPPEYEAPKFKRLNHYAIQFLHPDMLEKSLKVIAYGPAIPKYSPHRVFNYRDNTTTADVIWWDPARGSQHSEAHAQIDYELINDPAKYNRSLLAYDSYAKIILPVTSPGSTTPLAPGGGYVPPTESPGPSPSPSPSPGGGNPVYPGTITWYLGAPQEVSPSSVITNVSAGQTCVAQCTRVDSGTTLRIQGAGDGPWWEYVDYEIYGVHGTRRVDQRGGSSEIPLGEAQNGPVYVIFRLVGFNGGPSSGRIAPQVIALSWTMPPNSFIVPPWWNVNDPNDNFTQINRAFLMNSGTIAALPVPYSRTLFPTAHQITLYIGQIPKSPAPRQDLEFCLSLQPGHMDKSDPTRYYYHSIFRSYLSISIYKQESPWNFSGMFKGFESQGQWYLNMKYIYEPYPEAPGGYSIQWNP